MKSWKRLKGAEMKNEGTRFTKCCIKDFSFPWSSYPLEDFLAEYIGITERTYLADRCKYTADGNINLRKF